MQVKKLIEHLSSLPDNSEILLVDLDKNEKGGVFGEANTDGVTDFSIDGTYLTFSK